MNPPQGKVSPFNDLYNLLQTESHPVQSNIESTYTYDPTQHVQDTVIPDDIPQESIHITVRMLM